MKSNKNEDMESNKKVIDILDKAQESGISVFLADDKLKLKVAKNTKVDPEVVNLLKSHKEELTSFLINEAENIKKMNMVDKSITPFNRDEFDRIPLSFAQQRIWFIDQYQGSTQYHISQILKLTGDFDMEALESALKEIVSRHEVLRTVIREENGEAYQEIMPVGDWKIDLIEDVKFENRKALINYLIGLIDAPFDLSTDYMLRVNLVKINEEEYEFVIAMHHIASDGWSLSLMIDELTEIYSAKVENRPINLPKLDIQYADYAVWQRNYLKGERLDKQLNYWKKQLDNVAVLDLPLDYLRPASQSSAGNAINFSYPKKLATQVNEFSKAHGVTPFMTLLAAYKVMLYRYSGQEDICVGSPIAGRTEGETENLVGFFINMISLRSALTNNISFTDLLKNIKQTTLDAYANQDVPFEQIVEMASNSRDLSQSPVFQVTFALNNVQDSKSNDDDTGLNLKQEPIESQTSPFDVNFDIGESSDGLELNIQYCTDLFSEDTIIRMSKHYEKIVTNAIANPNLGIDDIPMLLTEERELILGLAPTKNGDWFNQGEVDLANEEPINVRYERIAAAHKDAVAIIHGDEEWTYEKLNNRANQFAHSLLDLGVQPGDFVGIYLDRSPVFISALLGILKAGAVYVPLDTQNPDDRITKMISSTNLKYLVSSNTFIEGIDLTGVQGLILTDELSAALQSTVNSGVSVKEGKDLDQAKSDNPPNQNELDSWAYILFTSGSTGQPKGAISRHIGAMNHVLLEYEAMDLKDDFRFLQSAGIGSDISVWQMLAPLLKGGAVVIISKYDLLDYRILFRIIEEHKVNVVEFVPSYVWGLIEHLKGLAVRPELEALNWLMLSGEEASVKLVNDWKATFPSTRILNAYGPCEASDDIAQYEVKEKINSRCPRVPIGRTVANMNIFILDKKSRLCPIGIPGELCVSGVGVGAGYLGMPERTAKSFVKNPFPKTLGDTLYRTGDLARWLADGNLDFLGRIDRQVKVRGNRVELGEIENVIRELSFIKDAHVLIYSDSENDKSIVAFLVISPEGKVNENGSSVDLKDEEKLKELILSACQEGLPEYMQPSQLCIIEKMPVNLSDKVDELKLIEYFSQLESGELNQREIVPCKTETEEAILKVWQGVLQINQIGADEDFFEIGGHSLLAIRIKSAIREALDVEVDIRELFTYKTIATLGEYIDSKSKGVLLPPITAQERPEYIPLSFSQERLWFIDRLEGSSHYHVPIVLRVGKDADVAVFEYAFNEVVNRHEILRTTYKDQNGLAYQDILEKNTWRLVYQDKTKEAGAIDENDIQLLIQTEVNKPFDLANDHMFRASLLKVSEEEFILVVVIHHIAYDGWSEFIIMKELTELYEAKKAKRIPQLDDLAIQYADYAIWQRKHIEGEVLEQMLSYWEEQLKDIEPLDLPLDFPRPAIQSTRGTRFTHTVDKQLKTQLEELAKEHDVTLFMVLLAAYKVLLYRYSGQDDICVGSPSANRGQIELEPLIGFFINTLALRSDLSGNPSFGDLLAKIKTTTLDAYSRQDVPLEKIVDRVAVTRDMSRTPLFQTLFVMQNTPEEDSGDMSSLTLSGEDFEFETAKFDLTFSVDEGEEGLDFGVTYCSDLFLPATIERMIEHFEALLHAIVADTKTEIGKLNMLSLGEGKALPASINQTTLEYPKDKTIVDLFEAQVAKAPEQVALVFENGETTYQALEEKANQLAHFLQKKGVEKNDLVGLCLKHPLDQMVLGILAIMKVGAAYVPIDPELPADRFNFILNDTKAKVLLANESSKDLADQADGPEVVLLDSDWAEISKESNAKTQVSISGDDLVYVIYTSGSTGQPKGVLLTHQNLSDYVFGLMDKANIQDYQSFGLMSTMSADLGNTVLYGALATGGTLHLFTKDLLTDAAGIQQYFDEHSVDVIKIVPSHWRALALEDKLLLPNRLIIFGGEELTVETVNKIKAAQADIKLINHYGPTETTIGKLMHPVDFTKEYNSIPIGQTFSNADAYVVNSEMMLCPIGVPGELLIGGDGLAKAYLNLPEQTAKSFIPNPFKSDENARVYRTGDLVQMLEDGSIVFKGRIDNQVKVRGYRIELGEVEAALKKSSLVKDTVVLAKKDANGNKRLVAYIVTEDIFNKEGIQASLKDHIPDYMIPSIMMKIEEVPLTSNGKVNRRALPDPDIASLVTTEYVAPQNEIEEQLVEIWQGLLHVEKVGVNDNFFELGGDSITSIQAVSRAKRVGLQLKPRDLFLHQTIAELAKLIEQQSYAIETEQGVLTGEAALAPIQQWFFNKPYNKVAYYNQAVILEIDKKVNAEMLESAVKALVAHHDALRFSYKEEAGTWTQSYVEREGELIREDLTKVDKEDLESAIEASCNRHQSSLNLENGDLVRAVLMQTSASEAKNRLFFAIHHLAVDGVSWRIILEDLSRALDAVMEGEAIDLGKKGSSYRQWVNSLKDFTTSPTVEAQLSYWENVVKDYQSLPVDKTNMAERSYTKDVAHFNIELNQDLTSALLKEVNQAYKTEINDILLGALTQTIANWSEQRKVVIGLEGHGREDISETIDITDTVGWFTNIYPISLLGVEGALEEHNVGTLIKSIKEQLRAIPQKGMSYGLLRYLHPSEDTRKKLSNSKWDIIFNYLGQFDNVGDARESLLGAAMESTGNSAGENYPFGTKLEISASIGEGQLNISWAYSQKEYDPQTIEDLANQYLANLTTMISHCFAKENREFTPSDYGLDGKVSLEELDELMGVNEAEGDEILKF